MIVFSVVDGIEQRQISLGPFDGFNVSGLAISPGGDVAATVPVGDGTDALVLSPAGSERVRVLARGVRFGRVAAAAGARLRLRRGLREGVRWWWSTVPPAARCSADRLPSTSPWPMTGRAVAWSTHRAASWGGPPASRSRRGRACGR